MSRKNGFGSGFILGSVVGGVVGGLLGTILATRNERKSSSDDDFRLKANSQPPLDTEKSIEMARHSLEDKIAQLNLAIDDVRQQLSSVERSSTESE